MKHLSITALFLTLMLVKPTSGQNFTISNVQWPQLSYTQCTNSDVFVNLIRSCFNSSYTGAVVTVSGFNLTVDVNYTVSGPCNTILDFPGHQIPLGLLPAGTYAVTVNANLNGTTQNSMASSLVVGVGNCCPLNADAGNDSTVCNLDSIQLNGNTPPMAASGKWSVTSGSALIVNDSLPNVWAENLSYGINSFQWKLVDSTCSDSATVEITNYELPSDAIVETDKASCYDTITIQSSATAVGSGKWTSNTPGTAILNSNSNVALARNMSLGSNQLIWTVTNGLCPKNMDTLLIEYDQVLDSPLVAINGLTLTADAQPSYQWFNGATAIPGETNQSYMVSSNGSYRVYSVVPNCDNGLFSEEVEVTNVGLNKSVNGPFKIYPNPSSGNFKIEFSRAESGELNMLNSTGQSVYNDVFSSKKNLNLSLSNSLPTGIYIVQLETQEGIYQKKLVIE